MQPRGASNTSVPEESHLPEETRSFAPPAAPPLRMTSAPPPPTIDERAELLRLAREGSEQAWEDLVGRYGGLVLSIAQRLGLSAEDCDEAFQNTWLAFMAQIDLIREPEALAGWLATTARRQCWRVRRRAGDSLEALEALLEDRGPSPQEEADRLERTALVQEAMRELSRRCRQLLSALYFGQADSTQGQVAESLGMPLGSVGPTRLRCLAKLATLLDQSSF